MKIVLKRILVPTDFSDGARSAVIYGLALAREFRASLHLIHVVDEVSGVDPLIMALPTRKAVERQIETRAWQELRTLLPRHDPRHVRAVLALEWGTPAVEIVRYAKTHAIDLIIIGTARRDVQHLIAGRVTEGVMRQAPCPVLTLHRPEREFVMPSVSGKETRLPGHLHPAVPR